MDDNLDVCKLDLVNPTTLCQYNLTRYFYDASTSSCKPFLYSGCFGNGNNFETIEECERKCQLPLLFGLKQIFFSIIIIIPKNQAIHYPLFFKRTMLIDSRQRPMSWKSYKMVL